MVEITVQLPDDIAKQFGAALGGIPRHLLEAVAVEGYRSARLSLDQVGELLHLNAQETGQFLAERQGPLRSPPQTSSLEADLDWEAFCRALPRLLETDKGKFVAIADGQIIDSDPDDVTLVERVVRQRPDQRILIQKVVEGGLEDIHIDTPEFEFSDERVA